jgi:hypothetical protein
MVPVTRPNSSDRLLVMRLALALAEHAGRPVTAGDRELAARLLTKPDGPLAGQDPQAFVVFNGVDCRALASTLIG